MELQLSNKVIDAVIDATRRRAGIIIHSEGFEISTTQLDDAFYVSVGRGCRGKAIAIEPQHAGILRSEIPRLVDALFV